MSSGNFLPGQLTVRRQRQGPKFPLYHIFVILSSKILHKFSPYFFPEIMHFATLNRYYAKSLPLYRAKSLSRYFAKHPLPLPSPHPIYPPQYHRICARHTNKSGYLLCLFSLRDLAYAPTISIKVAPLDNQKIF